MILINNLNLDISSTYESVSITQKKKKKKTEIVDLTKKLLVSIH